MTAAVELPFAFEQQLRDEALRAFPRECCGLIEGTLAPSLSKGEVVGGDRVFRVAALHPVENVANEKDSFEIDPASHIDLLRRLRGTGRAIIGCYHSHPNGRAGPSRRDCDNAIEPEFLWLICAVANDRQTASVAAYVGTGHSFSPVRIVDAAGEAVAPMVSPNAGAATGTAVVPGVDPFAAPLV